MFTGNIKMSSFFFFKLNLRHFLAFVSTLKIEAAMK